MSSTQSKTVDVPAHILDRCVDGLIRDANKLPDAALSSVEESTIRDYASRKNWQGLFGYIEIIMAQSYLRGRRLELAEQRKTFDEIFRPDPVRDDVYPHTEVEGAMPDPLAMNRPQPIPAPVAEMMRKAKCPEHVARCLLNDHDIDQYGNDIVREEPEPEVCENEEE